MSLDLEKIAQSLRIADLAIAHHHAKNEAAHAKSEYHFAWQRFETGDERHGTGDDSVRYVHQEERISKYSPQFNEACEATKTEHDKYKAKVRAAYNAKRRLETAIRGMK